VEADNNVAVPVVATVAWTKRGLACTCRANSSESGLGLCRSGPEGSVKEEHDIILGVESFLTL
jgi:hypothetical protein